MPTISISQDEHLKPRAHAPAGGTNLIASFKNDTIGQATTSFGGSTKVMHGDEASAFAGVTTLYHGNQQYSVTALSDSSGNVSERYAYTAYGQPTFLNASGAVQTSSAASNRYTYTGREWDATLGLHHFRARWMSGASGRFLTRDPIGYYGSEWGLHEFLNSRGTTGNDALGEKCCIKTWIDLTGSKGTHSALKCDEGYYSMYPHGPEIENYDDEHWKKPRITCIDCLNEASIAAKWNEIKGTSYWYHGANCSWFIWQIIEAGRMQEQNSPCRAIAIPLLGNPNCGCDEMAVCRDSCNVGTGMFYNPIGLESYFKCLGQKNCDPFTLKCIKLGMD